MQKAWSDQPIYARTAVELVPEDKTEPQDLEAALDQLAKKAGPDDRCILFLAGHGVFMAHKGGGQTFVFCCPKFDLTKPDRTGLPVEVLFEKLAAIPCQKLVLFDACHTGMVANPSRQLTPGGQGPIVLAACDRNQSSFENPKLYGHGLFTKAVLEALDDQFGKADKSGDNVLTVAELFAYTQSRLPELLRGMGVDDYQQIPQLWAPPGAKAAEVAARKKTDPRK
jgi:uncharacterized caspase-like protein